MFVRSLEATSSGETEKRMSIDSNRLGPMSKNILREGKLGLIQTKVSKDARE